MQQTKGSEPAGTVGEQHLQQLLASVEKHAGVVGVVIYENSHGQLVYTSLADRGLAQRHAQAMHKVCAATNEGLSEINDRDKASIIRIRTREHELIVKPEEQYTLLVIQDPVAATK